MSFVSFAQNFEDVMLWRALKHIDKGFYIDVGANDPQLHSVTKAFYERGWCGVNIEPIEAWFSRLAVERPRDVNLMVAAGSDRGGLLLYEIPETGLSTSDRDTAERHKRDRGYVPVERQVSVVPLGEICREHVGPQPVHFLKIDVEGAEKAVLQGLDFREWRPWIVLVEATLPNLQAQDYEDWEPILIGAGYEFVYFDGLNRFYVAQEHLELKAAFASPPNVFDDFVTWAQFSALRESEMANARAISAEARADAAESRARHAEVKAQSSELRVQEALLKVRELQSQMGAVLNSSSWRFTAPLRRVVSSAREPLASAFRLAHTSPRLMRCGLRVLERFPRAKAAVRRYVMARGIIGSERLLSAPVNHADVKGPLLRYSERAAHYWSIELASRASRSGGRTD